MASNLGVVELTVALHRALCLPRDEIVWDVGHQAYVHKLLTGRFASFATLRTKGGLSGFPSREESACDPFGTGHASTALSAALGLARARDMLGEERAVVAVVGDGAMTGGLCWEALNDAGQSETPLVVLYNDNGMSIARNVGALSARLARARGNPGWWRFKAAVQRGLGRLPGGGRLSFLLKWAKNSLKRLVVQGALFEELGVTYLGPVDGHDIAQMEAIIRHAVQIRRPVLVHAVTRKGRGYQPAEEAPDRYHGVAPDLVSKENGNRPCAEVVGRALCDFARENPRVSAITAAMPGGTGLARFAQEHPGRFFDVGIAEGHAATLAAGLAAGGMKPFFAVYATFLQRAMDGVVHDICLQKLPVTLLIDRAGLVGEDGPTHNGLLDIAWLRAVPALTLLAPRDLTRLAACLQFAVDAAGPVAIRYPRSLPENLPMDAPADGWARVVRPGAQVALVAVGDMTGPALRAAGLLEEQGIPADVWDAERVSPLDEAALAALAGAGQAVVTVENGYAAGGFGEGVAAFLSGRGCRVTALAVPAQYPAVATAQEQREAFCLTAEGIAGAARRLLQ